MEEKTISLIKKLIEYKTLSEDLAENERCITFVKSYLQKVGLKTKLYKKNGVFSLLSSSLIKKHYKLILCGHLDVVPGPNSSFKPKIQNQKLYGRGAADMKGSAAVMIRAIVNWSKENQNNNLALLLTTDEEIGGYDGVNYLINSLNFSAECVFIPDTDPGYKLLTGAKGVLHAKFTSKGKSSHASTPWLGENAIEKLMGVFLDLKRKFKNHDKNSWSITMSLGKILGGSTTNSVANYAEMDIDFRYPPKISKASLAKKITGVISRYKNVGWNITLEASPIFVNPNSKYMQLAKIAVSKILHKKPVTIKENGSSDARYFSVKKIPVIMLNPKTSNSHVDNEWISLKDIPDYSKILEEFINSVVNER